MSEAPSKRGERKKPKTGDAHTEMNLPAELAFLPYTRLLIGETALKEQP